MESKAEDQEHSPADGELHPGRSGAATSAGVGVLERHPVGGLDRVRLFRSGDLGLPDAGSARAERIRKRFRSPLSARYVLGRLIGSLIAVWGLITIVFLALQLTSNPAAAMVSPDAPRGELAKITKLMGFDRPVFVQYGTFMRNVLTGRFPPSIRYGESSLRLTLDHVPASLELGFAGLVVGTAIGIVVGYYAVVGRHAFTRRVPLAIIGGFQAMPTFFLAILLVLVFGVKLHWLPTEGRGGIRHLILPGLTLAAVVAPSIGRVFRTAMLDALAQDHVRTAQAKGLSPSRVRLRHVVGNALVPAVNVIGVQAGMMFGGAVVTETLFAWPGVGQLAVNALMLRDFPLVLADVTVVAIGFVVINFAIDIVGAALDPRTRR